MGIQASVHVNATPEQVWKVLMNGELWGEWYSTAVEFKTDESGGRRIVFLSTASRMGNQIKDYRENETMTVVDTFASDIYSVRPDGNGSTFTREMVFSGGVTMPYASQVSEKEKMQKQLQKFAELVAAENAAEPAAPKANTDVPRCAKCGKAYTEADLTLHQQMASAETKVLNVRDPQFRKILSLFTLLRCPKCEKYMCADCASTGSGYKCPACGCTFSSGLFVEPTSRNVESGSSGTGAPKAEAKKAAETVKPAARPAASKPAPAKSEPQKLSFLEKLRKFFGG